MLGDPVYEKLFAILNELDIRCFFYIGGNDSMDTIGKLYDYGQLISSDICFMGVPKTIDNDLAITDHTPGYGSVAKYISTITKEIVADSSVYDMKSIVVLEIMGRNAGWLTGSTALARAWDCPGVDFIYLPEIPFSLDKVRRDVEELQKTKKSVVIAVSEGVKDASGNTLYSGAASFDAGYVFFSSADLSDGGSYSLYAGSESAATGTAQTGSSSDGNAGGMQPGGNMGDMQPPSGKPGGQKPDGEPPAKPE